MMERTFLLMLFTYCIIGGTSFVYGDEDSGEVGKFYVTGKISLPSTGRYDRIPINSCIQMSVTDAIQCSGIYCDIKQRGSLIMSGFVMVNNEISFSITCKGGMGMYYVSATFHFGWCHDGTESMKKGDYHNDFQVEAYLKQDEEIIHNVVVKLTYFEIESFSQLPTTVQTEEKAQTIYGSIIFPKQGLYINIPVGSCLRVTVKPNIAIMCVRAPCVIPTVASLMIPYQNITFFGNRIYYIIKAKLDPDYYVVRAILNIGWCSKYDEDYPTEKWLAPTDYHTKGRSTFILEKDNAIHAYNVDLIMENNDDRFHCAGRSCYRTENCKNWFLGGYRCRCPLAVKCTMQIDQTFCGSDGNTYHNECTWKNADCFSRTIKKVHEGSCTEGVNPYMRGANHGDSGDDDDDSGHHSGNSSSRELGIGLGAIGLICIALVVVAAMFLKHKRQKQQQREHAFSNNVYGTPPYANIKESGVADFPAKNMENGDVAAVIEEKPPAYTDHQMMDAPPSYHESEIKA